MNKSKRVSILLFFSCLFAMLICLNAYADSTVTPTVTLNSISSKTVGATVTVSGTSSTPCYRMAAKYVHNGTTTWLGEVYSNTYSKSFQVTSPGTYTVTLFARSYPESDERSAKGSKTVSFTVYNPVVPTVSLSTISNKTLGNSITVSATSSTPCYRMSAKYVHNGTTTWLGDVYSSTYSKTFTPTDTGTYTVTVYSRSYPENDPRTGSANKSCTFTISYPQNNVSVKVFQDVSFLNQYSNQSTYINTTCTRVAYPFKNKWNIVLTPSYYNITGMPLENCRRGYYTQCAPSANDPELNCGSICENENIVNNHHKNFNKNCLYAQSTYGYSGFDLALVVSSANLCHKHNGVCDTCGLGMVPYCGSDFAMTKLTTTRGDIGNTRVIQHEISHNFGCTDSNCTPGQKCIMSGGFDSNSTYNLSNIWCDNCRAIFNRTLH